MAWTEQMVEDLKKMWDEGLTTGEIGKRLNVSKNSIVGKVHRLQLPARPSPIKKKDSGEDTAEIPAAKTAKATRTGAAAVLGCVGRVNACKTVLVVPRALVSVGQDFVGFPGLLEFFLGCLVAGVTVGVVLHGGLAVGLLYVVGAGVLADAQHLIVISFLCHSSHPLLQDHAEKMVLSSASRTAQRQNCLCAPHYNLFFG